jgi:DNA polymerase-3 subunit epsilon
MRLIFVDTETTGLSPRHGHRIIEIACVEMTDGQLTGREFHSLVNPGRLVPPEAIEIHGIDDAMLRNQPGFEDVAPELIEFVAGGQCVMHNVPFDAAFFAAEFERIGLSVPTLTTSGIIIDTLPRFRQMHPGMPCSLSRLCDRYGLQPESDENWDGALTDARMLARLWQAAGLQV